MGATLQERVASLRVTNPLVREFLAEFLGTFVLLLFGDAVVAQYVLSEQSYADFFAINWGWGVSVTLAVLLAGGVSGGHVNPAVTVAFACAGKFPWKKVPVYVAAQYLGAFLASAMVYAVYYEAIHAFELANGLSFATPDTAGIWATYPKKHLSHGGGILDQTVSTALLLLCICAVVDKKNMQVSRGLSALYIGFIVLNIGICFGYNCGYAINPARDLAPRIFTAIAGWGTEPFTYGNHWWVVPVIGTHLGAIIGTFTYSFFIENHWPKDEDCEEDEGDDSETKEKMITEA